MYLTYETLLETAKKSLVFEVLKALSFRYMEERQDISAKSPLPLMCNDKYLNKNLEINIVKRINTSFSVLHIKVLSSNTVTEKAILECVFT